MSSEYQKKVCVKCAAEMELEESDGKWFWACVNPACDHVEVVSEQEEEEYEPDVSDEDIEKAIESGQKAPFETIIH